MSLRRLCFTVLPTKNKPFSYFVRNLISTSTAYNGNSGNWKWSSAWSSTNNKGNRTRYLAKGLYPTVSSAEEARSLVLHLDNNGRRLLLEELNRIEEDKIINGADALNNCKPVTSTQLYSVFVVNCLPFVGFGILDNGIMIISGEYIDLTIGVALGISTMAAAALGNLISDLAGIGTAGYVEMLVGKFGICAPSLTPLQAQLNKVRWTTGFARCLGISIGCIIGMLPLLFYGEKDDKIDVKKT